MIGRRLRRTIACEANELACLRPAQCSCAGSTYPWCWHGGGDDVGGEICKFLEAQAVMQLVECIAPAVQDHETARHNTTNSLYTVYNLSIAFVYHQPF